LKNLSTGYSSRTNLARDDIWSYMGATAGVSLSADGPGGSRTMRYDWTAGGPQTVTSYAWWSGGASPRSSEWWIRWMSKEQSNFSNSTGDYKFLLGWPARSAGGNGEVYLGLVDAAPYGLNLIVNDGSHPNMEAALGTAGGCPTGTVTTCKYRLPSGWMGNWHVWAIHLTGLGTSNTTVMVYCDGLPLTTMQLSGKTTADLSGGWSWIQFGANINGSTSQNQWRVFREVGLYQTRPSLVDVVSQPGGSAPRGCQ
jgi:hypothetical protein